MMLMADDTLNFWDFNSVGVGGSDGGGEIESGGEFTNNDDDVNLCMDLDSFFSILGENPDPQESSPEDSSFQNVSQADSTSNVGNRKMTGHQGFEEAPPLGTYLPGPHASFLSYDDLDASNFRNWGSAILFESDGNFDNGKLELSAQIGSPFKMLHPEPQDETPNCGTAYNFAAGDVNHVPDCPEKADLSHVRGHVDSKYTSYSPVVENSNINSGNYGIPSENSMETLGAPDNNSCISMEISSHNAIGTELNIGQVYENRCSDTPATQYCTSMDDTAFAGSTSQYLPDSFSLQFMPSNEEMINVKDEKEFPTESARFNSKMISTGQFGRLGNCAPQMSAIDFYDVEGFNENYISPFSGNSFTNVSDGPIDVKGSVEPSTQSQSYTASQGQESCVKDEGSTELVKSKSSIEVVDEAVTRKFFPCSNNSFFPGKKLKESYSEVYHKTADRYPVDGGCSVLQAAKQLSSCVRQSTSTMKPLGHIKVEKEGKLIQPKSMGYNLSKISIESIQRRSLDRKNHVDDDSDICILEDISVPPRSNPSLTHGKSLVTSQRSTISDPLYHTGVGGNMKLKANDERFVFRVALQDLSQPKSESNPPDGVLAVPLLRHQKIALSWMVQKETSSLFCSGGILADDQVDVMEGLGKTISTIALILKERSPSSTAFQKNLEQGELEMLNLEDDDVLELDGTNRRNASVQARGRPAAGTLVVCPTSVLRQWAEELHNKVTGKANLSVLVYHGSNRTKDPCELAKYDVVLTTYSIVSMEVPKQPLVDKDDEEKSKPKAISSMELASSRKRKYPPSSDKRGLKAKKAMDRALLESAARPLARVNWFRVVLDEAQSIKNHRTQVARACWGLRAKRRWCLSGTPIQNAVDDLYSYFRFLKYDPYAVYQSFCSTIKAPINRNPADGYRKLQAVLKTIMLRRTKGTLLDGEPIVNLPPKSVELRRVDFSDEERDFYSRLEADSRAQFEVYAAAGTVRQNYVNILLMLLRLRQACDHPLLVNRNISTSIWKSSVEMAKKLPWDKRIRLLSCLEASLAICGICNDPPEDAVVTICGHVFCNQCICEHLTGDDNQCPNTNCKVQLSVSSVFSKDTLKSSLADQTAQEKSPDSSGSELVEALEPGSDIISFGSSKIKAVLKVLLSLSKPQDCTARNGSLKCLDESTSCPEASIGPHSWGVHKDIPDETSIVVDKDLSNPIKVAGEKAIVFSQWTRMLDLLEACLKNSSIQYRRLDGTMSVVARDNAVKDFNTRPEVTVMIMSLKAASLGLNMVAACHVVLLDLWWNPTTEDQAIDRAHRIGQTRPVTVLRLTVKDTVEDRILALQEKKREMVASAFGEDETGSRQTRLTVEDLQYLFRV